MEVSDYKGRPASCLFSNNCNTAKSAWTFMDRQGQEREPLIGINKGGGTVFPTGICNLSNKIHTE